jgi:hypothetical protein
MSAERSVPGQIGLASSRESGEAPHPIALLAVLAALCCQQENLHHAIASLAALQKVLRDQGIKDGLFVAINPLAAVPENMKQALDLCD